MAASCSHLDSWFQHIVDNIDVELIAPCLRTCNIISTEDQVELKGIIEKTEQVKLILEKVKRHHNGYDLFKDCLITANCGGHQKILLDVYSTESSQSAGCYFYDHMHVWWI